jgi:hypothetical protein
MLHGLPRDFDDERPVRLIFTISHKMPIWSQTHYLLATSQVFMKLIQTKRIVQLMADGAEMTRFTVADESINLFPGEPGLLPGESDVIASLEEGDSKRRPKKTTEPGADLWDRLKRHHRPLVLFSDRNQLWSLYEPLASYDLQLKKVTVASPPIITLEGAGSAILDLVYARRIESRRQHEWENAQIGQSAVNIARIAMASEIIENVQVPEGVKAYARQIVTDLLEKQARLNRKIGFDDHSVQIDV